MADISQRILTFHEKEMIRKELSVFVESEYGPVKRYLAYELYNGIYNLPFYWASLNIPEKLEYGNFRNVKANIPDSDIVLRPEQVKCTELCLSEFQKDFGGGIINLSTGSGKTIISLYIISKTKLKTLIVVNKVELMNQWKEAIKKIFKVKIGVIQGDLFETDCDICIGMLQTISQRKDYKREMFKNFSLVFIDEVHNTPSQVFSKALFKIRNKYVFGLSATIKRKDGMEKIFHWHIGPVIFSDGNTSEKQETEFRKINFKGVSSREIQLYNGKLNISQMLTNLANDNERTKIICNTLLGLKAENRNVLVLSDRIAQLEKIHKILGSEISGLFIGKMTVNERQESKNKKILLATYAIASEGFNHPELNTLLFATPRSNITQAIGRIYRKKHEIKPVIIDVVDSVGIFICQYNKRKKIYNEEISLSVIPTIQENPCLFD